MVKTPVSPATALLAGLIACSWAAPARARVWTLGPPPPLPPLPVERVAVAPGAPRWERVAQRQRPRWERVPSHERILVNHHAPGELLAIAPGPAAVEFVQDDRPTRRWERVESTARTPTAAPSRTSRRPDRLEILRLQPVAQVPVALVAEQPLGQEAISAPCSASLCNLRVMGRVWFRF